MTTKTKPAAATVSTDITTPAPAPAPTVLVLGQLPRSLTLSGMASTVFAQSVVLARNGFVFDPALPPEVFPQTGLAFLHMTLGAPEQHAINGAAEAVEQALMQEEREFEKRVEAAAKQMIEDAARKAKEVEAAAFIAEKRAQIAALVASLKA